MNDPHATGQAVGQLLAWLCCCGVVVLPPIVLALWLLLRRKAAPAAAGFAVPAPDSGWATHHLPTLGITVSTPPGVKVQEVGGHLRLELPSGYDYRLVRGDLAAKLAERRGWLESTPHRTQKQVLLAAPDAFAYRAQEGDLADLSFVVGKAVGGATWLVETHGAKVEQGEVRADPTPADAARLTQLQQQLAGAFARGEPPDGPVVRGLMDELATITARAAPKPVAPPKVTVMTPLECAQGIAIVRSLRPA
jgi:hypothetical protein